MDTGAPRARSVRGMSDFTPHTGSSESPSVTYPDGSLSALGPRRAVAERAGFEPAMGCPKPHFQCGAIVH